MRSMKLISLIVAVVGIAGLGAGFYYKKKLNEAKKGIDTLFAPGGSNPFSDVVGFGAKSKLRSYEIKIHLLLAVSAIMTAGGAAYFVYLRQKKS